MSDLKTRVCGWLQDGRRVAVATVISVRGSAPFTAGTMMAVTDDAQAFGTISTGCVESAIVNLAQDVFAKGAPIETSFASDGDDLAGVSLLCGGSIDVRIEEVRSDALPADFGETPATTNLIVAGANEYARAIAQLCKPLGYSVTIIDPRPAFVADADYPGADCRCGWPDEVLNGLPIHDRTAILLLSHDTRYDGEFLARALSSAAYYVGAIGSRRTQQNRLERLAQAGVSAAQVARLHAPAGLDLGSSTPHETAVAMLAEIIAVQNGRSAGALKDCAGPIHNPRPDTATPDRSEPASASDLRDPAVR